jgi:hypothetical protein
VYKCYRAPKKKKENMKNRTIYSDEIGATHNAPLTTLPDFGRNADKLAAVRLSSLLRSWQCAWRTAS